MRALVTTSGQQAPSRATESDTLDFQATWGKLTRNRWLVLAILLVVLGATAYFTKRQAPLYQSTASMRIEDPNASPLAEMGSRGLISGSGAVETEILVLQSRTLAEMVSDALDMNFRVLTPGVSRRDVFSAFVAPRDAATGIYEMRRESDGSFQVTPLEGAFPATPARVRPGESFTIGNSSATLSPTLADNTLALVKFSLAPFPAGVDEVRAGLVVNRPDARAQLIALTFSHNDRYLAAEVPNALMNAFIGLRKQEARQESSQAVVFLKDQAARYRDELAAAESNLGNFRETERVVNLEEEANSNVSRLAQLTAERDGLQAERDGLNALLTRIVRDPNSDDTSTYRQLATFPAFFSNVSVQNILSSLTEFENQRANQAILGRRLTFPEAQGVEVRIRELELQLLDLTRNYLQNLDTQLATANSQLARFDSELTRIPPREMAVARLQREQSLISDIYGLLQTRLMEAELQEAVESTNVRTVDSGLVPSVPISPNPMRNMIFALFIGLVLGIGAALGKEALDTKVHSKEDILLVTNGLPVLGIIPRLDLQQLNGKGGGAIRRRFGRPREIPHLERLVTRTSPLSPASEAYRMLRTSVTFANLGQKAQVLVVTSAMPGDGKSTSSANLAMTLAQQGVRTLLVDADLRKGVLHEILGAPREPGLAHLLIGSLPIEKVIVEVPTGKGDEMLHFLPGGAYPPNPAELLGSDQMRNLIGQLRDGYDMVIIDAPPLNLVTDASVLGTVADATILIARAGVTEKRALGHAASQLGHLHARISGIVLNDLDVKRSGYGGDYYAYGYSHAGNGSSNGSGNGKH